MTAYTHGHHESVLRSHRSRTAQNSAAYLLPHLKPSDRLLDVGAGPGTITADLAELVADVTATEIGPDELALTRATAAERGSQNIAFQVADVHALPFDDDSFDITHAHQVLQHVADPVQALRELARVTKPGGIVAVRDSDYSGFCWWPQVPALDTWLDLYRTAAQANGGEPDAGRRLLSWAHAAGLTEVTATSSTWCYATPAEREWWGGMWAERIVNSAIARQLAGSGLATTAELERISAGWQEWAADADGWISILHGELICRVD
ncbi:class I SAM-dependent methyltransferase [Gryllotalpicola protaetiae]|uniref:Methyltransferase domain-containing protein n=1 Tax=Gryllotalpicola protaetiae TaxID=2419771 RepID=A0A387BY98_9MICO|nr:methyltransferase domain-containing protein [Gryllotalpicola protaetiae]AYG03321.1 methyltransferase domain-containing protein [Gryllotalpicola protaetiae]